MGANHLYPHPLPVKAINPVPARDGAEVLHYVGYDGDRGGIVAIIRALSKEAGFRSILGVNHGFRQSRHPPLPTIEFPSVKGEQLGLLTLWRARRVAREVHAWLGIAENRVFHGHSRAGLAVCLWLARRGEKRAVASVHCYGRQRWFYRWGARRLGRNLFWLSPAMKDYYGFSGDSWAQCIPGCISSDFLAIRARRNGRQSTIHLGGVGAIVPWKRWDLILDALAAMPQDTRERLRFTHIGAFDGTASSARYAAALRQKTNQLGFERIVMWKGEQASAREFLGEIDCLVIASEREPFSIAMLESLAAGVPVLAADTGGAKDVIIPARNGWLFRSGDVGDLGRSMAMLAVGDALDSVSVGPNDVRQYMAASVARQWAEVYAGLLRT
jgi:glycosyltransferase involved in cell wall biosynthesis